MESKKKSNFRWIIIIGVLFLVGTLPFHYVPTALMVFPKEHLTFSYTFISQKDIDKIIDRYNNATNIFEQQSIIQEPLARKLVEKGIIYNISDNPKNSNKSNASNGSEDIDW